MISGCKNSSGSPELTPNRWWDNTKKPLQQLCGLGWYLGFGEGAQGMFGAADTPGGHLVTIRGCKGVGMQGPETLRACRKMKQKGKRRRKGKCNE